MKSAALWQISVTTSSEAEEAVAALLEKLFQQSASIYVPEESPKPVVTVYVSKPLDGARSRLDVLAQGLKQLAVFGLNAHPAKISVNKVPRDDWTESWKKYFKTIEVGHALVIKPSWSKRRARKGQSVVVINPGLSFGTGQHPTTAFCLDQLVACRTSESRQSFLDIGTGSGILAIAAAKLGYDPVKALDVDSVAVRVARANAQRNRVADRVLVTRNDLSRLSLHGARQYDLICANLISTLLLQESARILNRLRPGGRLVLAGILASEFGQVRRAYESAGAKLVASKVEAGWHSGAFILNSELLMPFKRGHQEL